MDYVFAIPSHKRAEILRDRTLKLLDKLGIPHSRINVFVSKSNIKDYRETLPNSIKIITSREGVANNRMFISDYFNEGQKIITIDDDVEAIYQLEGSKTIELSSINLLIEKVFNELKERGLKMAGIYPTRNPFHMKPTITEDLRFCKGSLRFYINDRFCERRKFVLLEDYETTIKYYLKYNGVLRINYISIKVNYLTLGGGMADNTDRSLPSKKKEVDKFIDKYTHYCWLKTTDKRYDLQFNNKHKPLKVQTLWIGDELNDLSRISIKSWLYQGYEVDLYSDSWIDDEILQDTRIKQIDAREIWDFKDTGEILPFSDLWRFKLLYQKGGVWLDADMLLLDQLPYDKILISSEFTMRSGAFKSKMPFICNIGALRFQKKDKILKLIIQKIEEKTKSIGTTFCDNMFIFRRVIKNCEYNQYVKEPSMFCGVDWWNAKELYYSDEYKTKYNVKPLHNKIILQHSIGVHLWNHFTFNKHYIDFNKIEVNSMFYYLKELFS